MVDENPFNKTFPSLICPICSKEFKVPHLTKCGHRFCEKCIKEKINRIHKCPECNQDLNLTDLEKDKNLENFLESFKSLYDTINDSTKYDNIQPSEMDKIFIKHYAKVNQSNQVYLLQIKTNYNKALEIIENKRFDTIRTIKSIYPEKKEIDEKLEIEIKESNNQKEELNKAYKEFIQQFSIKYDKTQSQNEYIIKAEPIKLRIKVMANNLQFNEFSMRPNEHFLKIIEYLRHKTAEMNNKISKFDNKILIMCFNPLTKYTFDELKNIYEKYLETNVLPGDAVLIENYKISYPITEYDIKPESEIVIFGKVLFEKDKIVK